MRIIAFVTDVASIPRILAYLREPTQTPRIAPAARGPPPFEEDFEPRKRKRTRCVGKPGPGIGP
jgi:hypothetical protein